MRAHRRLALTVFIAVFGCGALIALLLPPKYTSSMTILIRATPTDLRATPERADGVILGQVSEEEVNSEVELLTSYDVLQQAVIKNHLETPSTLTGTHQESVDTAVRKLGKALQVTAVRKANIIELQYSNKNPRLAASVLRTIEGGYLDAHLRAQSMPGGYQFFQKQAEYYGRQLIKAQLALAQFSSSQNAANLDQQRTLLTQTISDQQAVLQQSQAQVAQLRMEIDKSMAVNRSLSSRIATTRKGVPNPSAVDHLTTLLADLQDRRVKQASTFRDDDPIVEETDTEIAMVKKELQDATSLVAYEVSTDINPISQNIQNGVATRTVELAGLESKVGVLRKQIAANSAIVNHLTDVSGEYALLSLGVQNAQEDYNDYLQRQEDARVSEGLDKSKITNVVIAQEPTESQLPASSHRLLVLLLSLFVAVFGSIVSCVIAEISEPSHQLQHA